MDLSVVIPAKNEAENIVPLIAEIREALDSGVDYELIYIDDGSTDSTWETLTSVRDDGYDRLKLIRMAESVGQSTAIRSGVLQARGTWIATLDADGQNDPHDIPVMYERARTALREDADFRCIAGYRKRRHDSWLKKVSSKVANRVRRGLLHDETPDTGCGLKVFRRDAFLNLPYFDHMHRFIPALIRRDGGHILVHEVNHRPRMAGRSKYGLHNRLWVGIVDLVGVIWLQHRAKIPEFLDFSGF